MFLALLAIGASVMLLLSLSGTQAQNDPAPASDTMACYSDNLSRPTKQENFVREQALEGKEANLSETQQYGDVNSPCRILRSKFLESILVTSTHRRGVRIIGARFTEKLDLENADIRNELWLNNSILDDGADLSGLRSAHLMSFDGTKVKGLFNLSGIQINGDLFVSDGAKFDYLDLKNSVIRGHLYLNGSTIDEKVDMEEIRVEGNVDMSEGTFREVSLEGAHVGGLINLRDAKIEQDLSMDGVQLAGTLIMAGGRFTDIGLESARIGGHLLFDKGVASSMDLSNAQVKENFSLSGVVTNELNMSNTRIGGTWILRGNMAPKSTILSDMTFSNADWGSDPLPILSRLMETTSSSGYNFQLYNKLAKAYLDAGLSGATRSILIEKQSAEYNHSDSILTKAYLFITWMLAGYGYRPEIGFLWIMAFVAIGACVFKAGAENIESAQHPDNWLVFALDSVIPGIHLNKDHEEVSFSDWRQNLLYFMRLLGAVVVVIVLELLKRSVVESG